MDNELNELVNVIVSDYERLEDDVMLLDDDDLMLLADDDID